ncbi:MAG: LAGLIDADG family homing endonuclease [Candidatus Woesearchaeota archaeon]|jgi:intein/homing endonuclease|nr:LAGLIDADG family homing endonuclease [Candidatus Woesearchaeota archaeon]
MRIKKLKQGFEKLTKEKARIIAHSIGDGAVYITRHDYNIKYEVRDEESLKQFNDDLIEVYGLEPSWEWNTSGITGEPIKFVRLRSKLAYEDLLRYATYFSKDWKINDLLMNSNNEIKKEFLRALFDDEGSIIKERNRGIIKLYSINSEGLGQIQNILLEFDISTKLYPGYGLKRNVYALIVRDLELFNKQIGFGLKRKQDKLNELTS